MRRELIADGAALASSFAMGLAFILLYSGDYTWSQLTVMLFAPLPLLAFAAAAPFRRDEMGRAPLKGLALGLFMGPLWIIGTTMPHVLGFRQCDDSGTFITLYCEESLLVLFLYLFMGGGVIAGVLIGMEVWLSTRAWSSLAARRRRKSSPPAGDSS